MNRKPTSPTYWAALPVLLAGAFMVVLDFFIVNVALPSIATDLGAGDSSLEWVVAGYGLDLRRLPDHRRSARRRPRAPARLRGRPRPCSPSPRPPAASPPARPRWSLARVAQGVAGAVLMPQVLAIVGVTYSGPDYVRALSIYGVVLGLAAVGGQVIGGALVETDVAGLGLAQLLPDQRAGRPRRAAAGAAPGARVPRRAGPANRRGRRGAARRRADGGAAAPDRGPRARLAAVDLGLAGERPADPGRVPAPPAPARRRGRRPAAGPARCSRSAASRPASPPSCSWQARRRRSSSSSRSTCRSAAGSAALEAGLVFTILAVAYVVTSGPAPGLTARFGRLVVAAGGVALTLGLVLLAAGGLRDRHDGSAAGARARACCSWAPASASASRRSPRPCCRTSIRPAPAAPPARCRRCSRSATRSAWRSPESSSSAPPTRASGHAFELSLIQLAAVAAGIVAASRLLPGNSGAKSGINRHTKSTNRRYGGLRRMEHARIDISQDLDGDAVVHACFDLSPEELAAAAHAVAATAGERFRITELSARRRGRDARADGAGRRAGRAEPAAPARSCSGRRGCRPCATPWRVFVESRERAEWIREEDRQPLALLREMLFPLEQLQRRGDAGRAVAERPPASATSRRPVHCAPTSQGGSREAG